MTFVPRKRTLYDVSFPAKRTSKADDAADGVLIQVQAQELDLVCFPFQVSRLSLMIHLPAVDTDDTPCPFAQSFHSLPPLPLALIVDN